MRLLSNAVACYRFTGSLRAGFRNLAHSLGLYAGRALKGGI